MDWKVHSIGYERRDVGEFIKALKEHGIRRLADVRNAPFSKIPGFSKEDLEGLLRAEGIEYRSFSALGTPKELRERSEAMSRDEFLEEFRLIFERHRVAYQMLKEFLRKDGGAVMCLERDSRECHREVIEDELRKDGYEVIAIADADQKVLF